ncbi:MAG TPA: diacylglycerol kinase [Steroidobacteraceae bacterium]|nr:diacylglycerol kinase [Steroidobacteraceae bacterium]
MRHKHQPLRARFGFALHGLAHALASEASLRVQLLVALLLLVLLCVLRPEPLWWALAGLAAGGVLAAELFNTAIEQLADALHPQDSAAIRIVKDCAAAAVLMSVLGAAVVGAALTLHLLRLHSLVSF